MKMKNKAAGRDRKMKVMTVVGTRPEIIRLSRVMANLDQSDAIDHITVHTGQNYDYELNEIFYKDLEIRKPEYFLNAAGKTATETIGQMLIRIEPILDKENPYAFLVLGDTNSCLCAIPAKKKRIPIFHMEAGNRCFDQRVPEETNRKILDHLADINLPYSSIAREYLIKEGFPADRIIKTGSPMFEVINYYLPKIEKSDILTRLDLNLMPQEYFLVSFHREENVDNPENLQKIVAILHRLVEDYNLPVIISTHPRTRKKLETHHPSLITHHPSLHFLKPFGFPDYMILQMIAKCVLSDSGTISEESSILNFCALNIRETHERPEAMEEASVLMVGLNPERILQGLMQLQYQKKDKYRNMRLVGDYAAPNVSEKVVRILLSYTDYVKRTVWSVQ